MPEPKDNYKDANPYFREKKFIDLALGREGTFITKKKVRVESHPNISHGYKVIWVPDKDALSGTGKVAGMMTGRGVAKITEVIYPESALFERENPCGDEEGSHDSEVVGLETVEKGSPWLESLGESFEASVTELEQEAQQAEAKQLSEVAAGLENEGSSRVAESKETPRRQNRGRRSDRRRNRGDSKSDDDRDDRDRRGGN